MMEQLIGKIGLRWFYALGGAYVLAICAAIAMERTELLFMPLALVVIYMAFYHIDKLLLFVIFCTPFSVNIEELGATAFGLFLPTEPILFGILILYIIVNFYKSNFTKAFLMHPVTIAVLLHLAWMFLTCLTSENPTVSWKYFLVRLWFLVPMYFLAVRVFANPNNIRRMIWLYLVPLIGVVVYTLVRHGINSFSEEAGHWVMSPFFKDHTSYGAILALFYPPLISLLLLKRYNISAKVVLTSLLVVLTVGLIFSYTRAAWISLVGAGMVYGAIVFKVRWVHVAIFSVLGLGWLGLNFDQLKMSLEKNKSEHATEDFAERIESVSNISTDASNLERLNLWNCAWGMFEERPLLGWGPGTFQFNYGSFQHHDDLTIISQKAGRSVNAHSEYLGPLAESGVLGLLSMILIVGTVLYTGITRWRRMPSGELRIILMALVLGLVTYYAHAVLNNYMDTDKASVPVWAFVAGIVAIDLFERKRLALAASKEQEPDQVD